MLGQRQGDMDGRGTTWGWSRSKTTPSSQTHVAKHSHRGERSLVRKLIKILKVPVLGRVISINIGLSATRRDSSWEFGVAEGNNAVLLLAWGYMMVNLMVVKGSLE